MNEIVKSSVDARRQAIYNSYNITDNNIKNKVNDFFNRLEEYAFKYDDVMKFENDFQASDLNKEYINIFTEISSAYTSNINQEAESNIKSDKEYILDDIESEGRYLADDLTQKARVEARQKADNAIRDIPVVGDILIAKQHIDLFNKFTKKNKDE